MENPNELPMNLPNESQQIPLQSESFKKGKWKKWVILFIIGVFLCLLSFFYFIIKETQQSEKMKELAARSADSTLTLTPSSDWKTYTNNNLGISFQYPPNHIEPQRDIGSTGFVIGYPLEGGMIGKNVNTYWITFGYISQTQLNTMGVTYCGGTNDTSRCESKQIGGVDSMIDWGIPIETTQIGDGGKEEKITQLQAFFMIPHPNGGRVTFELQPVVPESKEIFNQILSTFKFLPQNSVTSKNACEEAKTEISDLLDKANYCEKSEDCKVIHLGCPFDCYNFVNKNSNSQNIQLAYSEYEKQCSTCIYMCIEPPTSNEIKCINKKCTNTRL